MELTLLEELMLLVLHDEEGNPAPGSAYVDLGLGAAVLMELIEGGWVELGDKETVRRVRRPGLPEMPILADAYRAIETDDQTRDAAYWVRSLPQRLEVRQRTAEHLVERGILRREEKKILWIIPITRYPEEDGQPEVELREHLGDIVLRGKPMGAKDAMLLALIKNCNLVAVVFGKENRKETAEKLEALLDSDQISSVLKKTIEAQQAAMVALMAATSATTVIHS